MMKMPCSYMKWSKGRGMDMETISINLEAIIRIETILLLMR